MLTHFGACEICLAPLHLQIYLKNLKNLNLFIKINLKKPEKLRPLLSKKSRALNVLYERANGNVQEICVFSLKAMKKAGEDILSYHKTVSLKIVQETETQEGHPAKIILPLY